MTKEELTARVVAAPAQPVPSSGASITLDFKMATELLKMFGGEPSLVTLQQGSERSHSGTGIYAWYSNIPEYGAEFLGSEPDDEAVPEATPVQMLTWPGNAAEVREFIDDHCQREEYENADNSPSVNDLYVLTAHDFLSAVNWWAVSHHHTGAPQPAPGAPHDTPHAELRKTWREGQRWQTRGGPTGQWMDTVPCWYPDQEYRRHPDDFDAVAPTQAGEYPPLGKGSLWRDAEGIRGYGTDPGPGPWYTTEDVHRAIDAAMAAQKGGA